MEMNAEDVFCTVEFDEFEAKLLALMVFELEQLGTNTVVAPYMLISVAGIEGLHEMSGEKVTDILSEYLRDAGADSVALVKPL